MEWKNTTHRPLGLTETVERLRKSETSTQSGSAENAKEPRTNTVRVDSVTRVEDDYSWGEITVGKDGWRYWGVYDGHAGWATSSILRNYLHNYVSRKIDQLSSEELKGPEGIEVAIKSAFIHLDDVIISDALAAIYEPIPHSQAMCRIAPASAGSCALLALHEPGTSTLHVAGTGDSRAVLGRQKHDGGEWAAILLSVDHTGHNPDEVARINAEHPDEDHLFSAAGRLLGSEVTRSFGDHQRKWPGEALEDWRCGFCNIQVQSGDFLILATDGFWNHMSNEDAVYCARLWIEAQRKVDKNASAQVGNFEESTEHLEPPVENICLPVENTELEDTIPSLSGKEPERQMYPYNWVMEREDFVVEQDNLATHLVRNPFGGKEHDLFCSVMSTLSPDSKQARDDVTVIVVLF